jgi:hypothetical protein
MSVGDAERQPLLASQEQSVQDPQSTDNISVPVTNLEAPTDADATHSIPDAVEQTTYLRTVLWYIILISGGITTLIFFKALIDAGEADVSPLQQS